MSEKVKITLLRKDEVTLGKYTWLDRDGDALHETEVGIINQEYMGKKFYAKKILADKDANKNTYRHLDHYILEKDTINSSDAEGLVASPWMVSKEEPITYNIEDIDSMFE